MVLSGLCRTVLDILQPNLGHTAQNGLLFSAKLIDHISQIIRV